MINVTENCVKKVQELITEEGNPDLKILSFALLDE